MTVLLLCGYRAQVEEQDVLGLSRDEDGVTLIDRRIRDVRALGHNVVCVLSGAAADRQLLEARSIQHVELVFDTNEPSLVSNLKAGVKALEGEACFVLPVEIPVPEKPVWDFLRNELGKAGFNTDHGVLQAVTPQGAPWHYGFPLLVTRNGARQVENGLQNLLDTRLHYLHLVYHQETSHAETVGL